MTREGAPVTRLQEQPSRVLAALTSQAGQLVTRDDLCRLLWPENSLVDADNGLNIAINKIRHALDDSAAQPRFIQTVPRRGYRFIANIERPPALTTPAAGSNVEPGADHVQSPTLSQPVQSVRRVRMFGFATAGLLIVVFVVASTWSIAPRSAAIRSAAVMPFVNLAGDRGLDYVVQGLTDTLATELAARGVPRVISPEATAHFKNSSASPGQMARELHADALVFGTVVRDGASFAVNVRLVNGQTERQLWVKRFVRASPIELTFSEDVLSGLAPALGLASVTAAPEAGRAPITAAARDEYLRGRYFWNMRTADGMDAAVEHLTRAVDIERHYALAWAGLADVYAAGGDAPSTALVPWSGAREAGLRAADEALRLNPSLGEAHAALGKLRMAQWRWGDAERELAEAVRLSPNYATARQWYGTLLMRLQKCPGAVEQMITIRGLGHSYGYSSKLHRPESGTARH